MKIKFICLNLWIGGILFDSIIDFLKKEKPDILALQEVHNGTDKNSEKKYRSIEMLRESLPLEHVAFAPTYKDRVSNITVERGNAIFSKFPILSSKVIFYDMPYREFDNIEGGQVDHTYDPRNLQHSAVLVNKETLNVYNTQGIWGLDGEDNTRRLEMSRAIVDEFKGQTNVILAGDFNVRPNTKTITNIEKHLISVFKDELTTSFNMKRKTNSGYSSAVVDMIFVSPNIKVVDHYCPNVDVSDHLPLVAILEV